METDLQVWEAHLQLTTGQTAQDMSPTLHHPRLAFLLRRRSDLVAAIADLEQQHAFRGDSTQVVRSMRVLNTSGIVCVLKINYDCEKNHHGFTNLPCSSHL